MISLIVARAPDGAIGKDNRIPWEAPEDLAFFQRETLGGALVMGRKTWESLPYRPLKRRLNLVVSSSPDVAEHVFPTVQAAVSEAFARGHRRVYGIGGTRLFEEMLPMADRLLVTEVDVRVEGAEAFFPEIPEAEWDQVGETVLRRDEPACLLRELLRRRA